MARIKSPSQRAYVRRMVALMAVYVTAILGGSFAERAGLLNNATTILVALVSGLCIAGVFWAIGRLIVEEQDEFRRMLMVRQALIATGFSLSIASIHGFLSVFELLPRVDLYWVAILWFAGLIVGGISNKLKYDSWGQCL